MLDARLIEPGAEDVEAVLERAEHEHLFAALHHLPDEFQGRGDLGNVGVQTARIARRDIMFGTDEQITGRVRGGDAQRLQLSADGRPAIDIQIARLQMKLIRGGLTQPHWHAHDMTDLRNDVFAAIVLAPAKDDRREQFPGAMHIAHLRRELDEPALLFGVFFLG